MQNPELSRQVQLLSDNIEVFSIPINHLNETEKVVSNIENSVMLLKEQLGFTRRSVELSKDGFVEIKHGMEKIITKE